MIHTLLTIHKYIPGTIQVTCAYVLPFEQDSWLTFRIGYKKQNKTKTSTIEDKRTTANLGQWAYRSGYKKTTPHSWHLRHDALRKKAPKMENPHQTPHRIFFETLLARDGTAEPISRDCILRRKRGHGNFNFSVQLTMTRIRNRTGWCPVCCCCGCCLHIKNRSDLYSVPSNIRTGPTDANAFRGHRLSTPNGYILWKIKEIKGPRKVNTHATIGKKLKKRLQTVRRRRRHVGQRR